MIADGVGRAIVAILDENDVLLGTGFLIGLGGEVLTAKHVLRGRDAVQVQFPSNVFLLDAVTIAEGTGTGDGDWALLRVEPVAVPAGTAPTPWSPLGDLAEADWFSIGHAGLRAGTRGGFHGRIVVASAKLELFCTQLDRAFEDDAEGLSGAPCVVGGEVVGLIVSVLADARRALPSGSGEHLRLPIAAAEVHAIPLEAIAAKCPHIPDEATELPWQAHFTGAVRELNQELQRRAARTASVRNPIDGPRLPRRIAREMIRGKAIRTSQVIADVRVGFPDVIVDRLMGLARTLWVERASAEHLATIATVPATGLLATELDWSAQHHFKRAEEHHRVNVSGSDRWGHVLVQSVHEEPFVESVVEDIRHQLDPAGNPRRIEFRLLRERIVAFVACPPREDLVQRLCKEWPQLVVVFLSRATPSGGVSSVVQVTPGPSVHDEEQAEFENEYAASLLARSAS
ncbi:MAG TPA: serine protease [Kofleriaceae bacterium]|nr:serine protease [Kofleriaceae bacterium]